MNKFSLIRTFIPQNGGGLASERPPYWQLHVLVICFQLLRLHFEGVPKESTWPIARLLTKYIKSLITRTRKNKKARKIKQTFFYFLPFYTLQEHASYERKSYKKKKKYFTLSILGKFIKKVLRLKRHRRLHGVKTFAFSLFLILYISPVREF